MQPRVLSILFAILLTGCSSETPRVGFTPDPRSDGAEVWLDATPSDDSAWTVEVRAAGLGPVFGYSFYVSHDPGHLTRLEARSATSLGPDASGEAIYLVRPSGEGAVALGGARRGRQAGPVTIATATTLATLRLDAARAGRSRLALSDVVVRRDDGGFVSAHATGGTLITE
jgi:hypothetical protein